MRKYYLKNPEEHYDNETVDIIQEEMERRLRDKDISGYRQKIIISGEMIEVMHYPIWTTQRHNERANKEKESRMAQKNINDRNAKENLIRLINTNFTKGDTWIHLSYDKAHLPKSEEEAHINITNYIRRLAYISKKKGLPDLKYVYITGYDDDPKSKMRYHHHVVTNFHDRDVAESLWNGGGRTQARRLQPDDYKFEGMARYMGHHINAEHRFVCSRNLDKPKMKIDDYTASRKMAGEIARNPDSAKDILVKIMAKKGYDCQYLDVKVKFSQYVSGAYIYSRLRIKENTKDNRTDNMKKQRSSEKWTT